MEQEIQNKALSGPESYINTGKATILAIIKLAEALVCGYALYVVLAKPAVIQKALSVFYEGFSFNAQSQSAFFDIYRTLLSSAGYILAFELLLIVLDGFGSFFTRVAHKGAGLVRTVHTIRYIFSIIGFIGCFYIIFRYAMAMMQVAETASRMGMADVFTFLGSYELVIYIIVILGAFWIFMDYDRYVAKVMKQVSLELKAGEIKPYGGKAWLRREALWFACILGASAVLSVVELAAGDSALAGIASYVKPIEILYRGSNVLSIAVVAVLAVKFLLVNRCTADFDKAHQG